MTPISHTPVLNQVDKTKAAEEVKKFTNRIFCDSINQMLFSSLYSNQNSFTTTLNSLSNLSSKKIDCPIKKVNAQQKVNIQPNDSSGLEIYGNRISQFKTQVVLYIDTVINTLHTEEMQTTLKKKKKLTRMNYLQTLFNISSKNGDLVDRDSFSLKLRSLASMHKRKIDNLKKEDEKIVNKWIENGGETIDWDLFFKKVFPKLTFDKKGD